MRATWLVPVLAVLATSLHFAAVAGAVPCGKTDPATGKPARAALTLDDLSVTTLAYGRDTDPMDYLLRFTVTGCDLEFVLSKTDAPPNFDVLPKKGAKQIPKGVVTFSGLRARNGKASLRLSTDAATFKPGSYEGLLEIDAPELVASSITPIALSRSEDNELKPFGIGALGGAVGFIWFGLLKFLSRKKMLVQFYWLGVVLLAATVVGGLAALQAYQDQDVWTVGENWRAALAAGVAGATTGTMAAVLPAIWAAGPAEQA